MVENQYSFHIQCLQFDNGEEFKTFTPYLTTHGITHRCSCPYTPEQNDRVERKMRHLVETGLALLATSSLPLQFWLYAFHKLLISLIDYQLKFFNFNLLFKCCLIKLQTITISKCSATYAIHTFTKHKLCYRSSPCVFLGYSPTHKGYMCFDSKSNSIYITRHVKFHETKFPFQQIVNTSSASSSYQFMSIPTLLPIPLSIPPTQTS